MLTRVWITGLILYWHREESRTFSLCRCYKNNSCSILSRKRCIICGNCWGCYENSDLKNTDLRPQKTQTPWVSRKHRPRKTQTHGCRENSYPQYFSNITANYSPRANSLSFASTEANGFAQISPERKFALANFDKTKFCWRVVTFAAVFKLRGQVCW